MSTFILINKPPGPTSHDIIDKLRKITKIKKIGHAGTLDPFAQGLLLVAIGRDSTKHLSKFIGLDKEYQAALKLGATSDTYDKTGRVSKCPVSKYPVSEIEIKKVLKKFIGKQEQTPPMFSAKKIKGQKLYKLARQGKEIERHPQKIEIKKIKLKKLEIGNWKLEIEVLCTSGTYIRSLAHDIGKEFDCGAYLEKLVRTKIGNFKLENAVELNKINNQNWQDYCISLPKI